MIDLSMIRRGSGKTARQELEHEPIGFAVSFTPSDGGEERSLVFRWPFLVTALLGWLVLLEIAKA